MSVELHHPPTLGGAPLASWGSRVGAAVLDGIIVTVPVVAVVVLAIVFWSALAAVAVGVVAVLAYLLALVFYAPLLMAREGRHNGRSWGKQIVGITVVRDNGVPFDFGYAFLREFIVKSLLFWLVGSFFLFIPTLLDYLWPLWDDESRCLHDMVVSTHVVRV